MIKFLAASFLFFCFFLSESRAVNCNNCGYKNLPDSLTIINTWRYKLEKAKYPKFSLEMPAVLRGKYLFRGIPNKIKVEGEVKGCLEVKNGQIFKGDAPNEFF